MKAKPAWVTSCDSETKCKLTMWGAIGWWIFTFIFGYLVLIDVTPEDSGFGLGIIVGIAAAVTCSLLRLRYQLSRIISEVFQAGIRIGQQDTRPKDDD